MSKTRNETVGGHSVHVSLHVAATRFELAFLPISLTYRFEITHQLIGCFRDLVELLQCVVQLGAAHRKTAESVCGFVAVELYQTLMYRVIVKEDKFK